MPQELTTENTVLTGGKVKPKDDVTVYGTEASGFLVTGEPYLVHKSLAEKLISQGKATKENPNPDAGKKGKKGGDDENK